MTLLYEHAETPCVHEFGAHAQMLMVNGHASGLPSRVMKPVLQQTDGASHHINDVHESAQRRFLALASLDRPPYFSTNRSQGSHVGQDELKQQVAGAIERVIPPS